jgi:anti-sigma factor RsiW
MAWHPDEGILRLKEAPMSECEQAGRLSAYHDGELDAAAAGILERHVLQCASCSAELGRIRGLSRLLGGLAPAQPSPQALRRFHRTADLAASGAIRHWAEALTAIAAAILVTFSAWLWRAEASQPPTDAAPTWEVSAVHRPTEPSAGGSEDQFAAWAAQDLSSQEGPHGQN